MTPWIKKLGKKTIKWQLNQDGTYSGGVVADGKISPLLHDEDERRLLVRLHNEAGKLEPNYFGMEEALARFDKFMPGGFEGEQNLRMEREYKVAAHEALTSVLSAEQAADATMEDASRVRSAPVWINLLSPYESMHLKSALDGPSGPAFLQAAGKFAAGEYDAGCAGMHASMKAHGPITWPIVTYFPFLWDPSRHMFLKPVVTKDFAERIGHPFQYDYSSALQREVYESLLHLTDHTRTAISHLKPTSNIDVQSFIWVVGSYTDRDLPDASAAEAH